jgi:hypothetical protein
VEDPVPVDAEAKSNAMNGLVGILIVRADSRPRLLVEDDTRHAHPTPSAVDAETRMQTGASVTPANLCGKNRESIARGKPLSARACTESASGPETSPPPSRPQLSHHTQTLLEDRCAVKQKNVFLSSFSVL